MFLSQAISDGTQGAGGAPQGLLPAPAAAEWPLKDGGATGVRCRVAPLLPDRPLVTGADGAGIAFSRRGSSVKDMEEFYSWAMDIPASGEGRVAEDD